MDQIKDFAALVSAVSALMAIVLLRIASTRFRRQVIRKMCVDRDDMLSFWRLGRWSCFLGAIAFGVLSPILYDVGEVEFSYQSLISMSLVLSGIGLAIVLSANVAMLFGTKYSIKWRDKILGSGNRQDSADM